MLSGALVLKWVARYPRRSCAVAFGAAAVVTIVATWRGGLPNAWRLVVMGAATSAFAGAVMGRRVLDSTRTPLHAGFMGGATSLLSLLLFSEGLAVSIVRDTRYVSGVMSLILLTPLFALLAVGWAVAVVGVVVGWVLRKAIPPPESADIAA